MKKTIEQKAAAAILQTPETIMAGGKSYEVAPPCVATLIKVSELVSYLPKLDYRDEEVIEGVLANAKHCRIVGDIAAVLLLGIKRLTEKIIVSERQERRLFGVFKYHVTMNVEKVVDRRAELSKELLETLTPTELLNLITQMLNRMQVADFFALTTFLNGINLLRETRKVGN